MLEVPFLFPFGFLKEEANGPGGIKGGKFGLPNHLGMVNSPCNLGKGGKVLLNILGKKALKRFDVVGMGYLGPPLRYLS